MTHSRRLSAVSALLLAAVFAGGVAGQSAAKAPPLDIGMSGDAGQFLLPDPKLPGKFLWKIYAQSASGGSQDNGFQGTLRGVTAYLYQHGALSARMSAPVAGGNNVQQVITATGPGRVAVRSFTQPGTTLEADKMTWYAKKNRLIAVGNVVYHDGKTNGTMRVPRAPVVADTALKSVAFGKGSGTLP